MTDSNGRDLGTLSVERVEGELLLGTFTPGADYPAVRSIFDGFAEAVEYGALSVVDDFDRRISALGIRVTLGDRVMPAHDVQIYPDGAASCRVPLTGLNGAIKSV